MRYAPGHKAEARARILSAVGRGFRQHSFGGIGVDGLAKEAQVTSGAFYGHFPSKEAAFQEVLIQGLAELRDSVEALRAEHGAGWLEPFVDFYLGHRRLCGLADSCALQSLTPDVQRAELPTKALFEAELRKAVKAIADGLTGGSPSARMARGWALLSILSGGVTIARSVDNAATSDTIAAALRTAALAIGQNPLSFTTP
jgi:TetR/AcrR family transcriptional regulator, transcriptional repressor for nem operon